MRDLSPAFAEHLAGGVTTLARCWLIARRDGVTLGFTDHDDDLVFNGTTLAARSGVDSSQVDASLGLAVGGSEISGALTSATLTEADLANGLYDGASVETWIVNWSDVGMRELLDVATVGEISRSDIAFTAELRSLAHAFDQTRGRLYQAGCSADLGDDQCKVALASPTFSTSANATSGGRLDMRAALGAYASGWFTGGVVTFTSGANASARAVVKAHAVVGAAHIISFWTLLAHQVAAGDAFSITAGCDKAFATCRSKFDNIVNFRGFPHMPGNDVVASYPMQGDGNMDGGSLFR
jgi:uncharacterized phage protein (TIGR02218 family)